MPNPADLYTGSIPQLETRPSVFRNYWQEVLVLREEAVVEEVPEAISRRAVVAGGLRGMTPPWSQGARSPRERLTDRMTKNGGNNG